MSGSTPESIIFILIYFCNYYRYNKTVFYLTESASSQLQLSGSCMFLARLVILHSPPTYMNPSGRLRAAQGGLKRHLTLMVHAAGSAIFHCLRMEIHQIKKKKGGKSISLIPRSGRDVMLQQRGRPRGGGITEFLSTNQRLSMQMSGSKRQSGGERSGEEEQTRSGPASEGVPTCVRVSSRL